MFCDEAQNYKIGISATLFLLHIYRRRFFFFTRNQETTEEFHQCWFLCKFILVLHFLVNDFLISKRSMCFAKIFQQKYFEIMAFKFKPFNHMLLTKSRELYYYILQHDNIIISKATKKVDLKFLHDHILTTIRRAQNFLWLTIEGTQLINYQ